MYEPLQRFAESLGATILAEQDTWGLRVEGRPFELRVDLPSKAPPVLRISTPGGPADSPPQPGATPEEASPYRGDPRPTSPCPLPFELRPERSLDRLGKRLFINREVQVGDPAFDAQVYIECDAPDGAIRKLLQNPLSREATLRCLGLGADSLALDERGWLTFRIAIPYGKTFPDPASSQEILAALGQLAEGLPVLRGVLRRGSHADLLPLLSLLWAVVGIFVAMFAVWRWDTMLDEALKFGALGGLASWIVSLPLCVLILRGRSTSLRDLFLTVLCNLWGFPLLGAVLLLAINGAFLEAPVESAQVQVTRSWISKGSKSTTYYIEVIAPGEKPAQISVESSLYYRFLEPQPARMLYRTGRLGWRRLVDVKRLR